MTTDLKWVECRKKVFERDKDNCRLFRILSVVEALILKKNAGMMFNIIDPAHVFPKSTHSWMKYDPENIVCLNRYSHSMLEQSCHPITGVHITKDEEQEWWKQILGNVVYSRLLEKSKAGPASYIIKINGEING